MTRNQIISLAKDLLLSVPEQYQVSRAYVYGSWARGDADAFSDLDILLLAQHPVTQELKNAIRDKAWELSLIYDCLVSVVTVSEADFENGPLSVSGFARNVRKEGFEVAA